MDFGFKKVPVIDPRLAAKEPEVAVYKGASSVSAQVFQALTASSSQLVFSCVIPSLGTIVDRYAPIQSTFSCSFLLTAAAAPAAAGPIVAGESWSIAAFPLTRLQSSITVSLNDSSLSQNNSQCLSSLLRFMNSKKWRKTAATTPTALGKTLNVGALTGTPADVYSNMSNELYGQSSNAAFPFQYLNPNTGSLLSGNGTYTFGGYTVSYTAGIPQLSTSQTNYPVAVQYTVVEPIMCSPFVFGGPSADYSTGLSSLTAIQVVAQVQSPSSAGIFKSQAGYSLSNIAFLTPTGQSSPFVNTTMQLAFLSPPVGLKLPSRNIVPLTTVDCYPAQQAQAIAAAGAIGFGVGPTVHLVRHQSAPLIRPLKPTTRRAPTKGTSCIRAPAKRAERHQSTGVPRVQHIRVAFKWTIFV